MTGTLLFALPTQPSGTPWPTRDWPQGELRLADRGAFAALVDEAFAQRFTPTLGETHVLLVVQDGRITFERYGEGFTAGSTHHSWSKAKSITHALAGLLVQDGKLDIEAPADVPEWAGDARAGITLDHLLRMSSGLRFVEEYDPNGPASDVIAMLFGEGADDVAGYARSRPARHEPGAVWSYSSGTTNIVCSLIRDRLGGEREVRDLLESRLFGPLGMRSATARFDAAGTFIGSSYVYATARDFARFGHLYLCGGRWGDSSVVPDTWVSTARDMHVVDPENGHGYSWHWWNWNGRSDTMAALGYEGQRTIVDPTRDLVVVHLGKWVADVQPRLDVHLTSIVESFDV